MLHYLNCKKEEMILQICLVMLDSGNIFYPLFLLMHKNTNILNFLAGLKISFSVPLFL